MHKITRESDEYVCSCGLRWATDEADPHDEAVNMVSHPAGLTKRTGLQFVNDMGEAHKKINTDEHITDMRQMLARENEKKECYQCEKPVDYLFPDSRCKDCTRLTPDELKGIENDCI